MYSKEELLLLAGKLATASENLLAGNTMDIIYNLRDLKIALDEYNNAIINNALEGEK